MLGKSQEVSRMAYYHPLSFSVHNTLVYLWYYYRNSSPIKVQRYSSFLTLFPPQVRIFKSAAKGSYSSECSSTDMHYIHQVLLKYLFLQPLFPPCCWLVEVDAPSHPPEASVAPHRNKSELLHLGQLYSWTEATDFLCQENNYFGIHSI